MIELKNTPDSYGPRLLSVSRVARVSTGFVAIALAMGCCLAQAASDHLATDQLALRLIAATPTVHAGEPVTIGIEQRIAPGWHTYWKNPGDSGFATKIEWHLPEGSVAEPTQWPVPTKFGNGEISNYGYADHAVLLSRITVPPAMSTDGTFPVRAHVKWLACREICIPQEGDLAIDLPVEAAGHPLLKERAEIVLARSRLPQAMPLAATVARVAGGLRIALTLPDVSSPDSVSDAWFYADRSGPVAHGARQEFVQDGDRVTLQLAAGEAPLKAEEPLSGVLVLQHRRGDEPEQTAYVVDARPGAVMPAVNVAPSAPGLVLALVLSFVGGVLLNLMPCVFPVLSIKALALFKYADASRAAVRRQGYVYTLGVLTSFLLLGVALVAIKAGGGRIGWGLQFQAPGFVLGLAYLLFAIGLNLSGVFEIGGVGAGVGASLASRGGYVGSFFSGVLASVVATPCTAPFMGAAIGFALGQSAPILLAVLLSLGLGLAAPYLLLTHWPALQARLPRPGAWMETLRQLLAFPMYGAAVWLVWVLARQTGPTMTAVALVGGLLIAFSAWLFRQSRSGTPAWRHAASTVAGLAAAAAVVAGYGALESLPEEARNNAPTRDATAMPYSRQTLDALRARGEPVLLNFTAAWCISCLVNEQVALGTREVHAVLAEQGIAYLKGDWTNQDGQIGAELARFGRSGVPLYVFYPKGVDSKPVVLPQILTPSVVIETLRGVAAHRKS